MSASTSVPLTSSSQAAFIKYYRAVQDIQSSARSAMRNRLEKIDRAYQREVDRTQEHQRAKAANAQGDTTRFQNTTVPVVMPQVETAVAHQTSVFLTGYPLFGVVAAPEFMEEALQMESILEDEALMGGWQRQLILFFRDGAKYNYAPLEVSWVNEVTHSVETNLEVDLKTGVPKKVIWSGNKVKRLDPYNTFVDPRVKPCDVATKGEFAGYTDFMTRIELKAFIATLPDKLIANIAPAFSSSIQTSHEANTSDSMGYYVPDINPSVSDESTVGSGTNWLAWAGMSDTRNKNIDYKDTYEVTILYARVLPSEFNLAVPNKNTPQIYKLIIVNHTHIIYCELQTNAHNLIPILIGQPLEDGLGYQTKSLADNGAPFQELTSTYMNSIIASRRRAVNDRLLYDPSRITGAHINSDNPSAKIPVRPAAYGKTISDAVYQFPYREDQSSSSIQQIQILLGLSESLSGQNKASQGQFVKGNRTLEEYSDVMQNASGRDQLSSILLEHQVFVPLKRILKLNILQYQGGTTIYNRNKQVAVEIDPVALRKAVLEFKVSDGLVPSEKILSGENFSVALQVLGSSPQLGAGYNIAPMFSYMMKTQGADISEFEKSQEQVAYEQAVAQWQSIMQLAIEKGLDPKTIGGGEMPTPEMFGYKPAGNEPQPDSGLTDSEAQPAGQQPDSLL